MASQPPERHTPRHTRLTLAALLDQANAADRPARAGINRLAGRPADEQETLQDCGPVLHRIVTRIPDAVRAIRAKGHHELCPHLTYDAPAVGIWLAWKPDRIRCPTCADHALGQTPAEQQTSRCDGCHQTTPTTTQVLVHCPPVVDLKREMTTPAIVVMAGLCPACLEPP
jgi:hypothetical protein